MNFLSHHYYELPENDALFVSALAIPDLTRGFTKCFNQKIKHTRLPEGSPFAKIQEGILSHYAADKKFHNSPAFMQQVNQLTHLFVSEGMDRNRLRISVLSHLAVELMLDRHILLNDLPLATEYYRTLEEADIDLLGGYFANLGLTIEKQDFLSKFHFFRERKYLLLFNEVPNIAYALSRIYSSTLGIQFTERENVQINSALNNIDKDMRYNWRDLLKV